MRYLVTALGLFVVGMTPVNAVEPRMVSIIQLIAAPQAFDGKRVIVLGVPRIEFEGNGLYLHKEDYDFDLTNNALWLEVPADKRAEWKALEGKYVIVEGTFRAGQHGHMDMYSGSLDRISRFKPMRVRGTDR